MTRIELRMDHMRRRPVEVTGAGDREQAIADATALLRFYAEVGPIAVGDEEPGATPDTRRVRLHVPGHWDNLEAVVEYPAAPGPRTFAPVREATEEEAKLAHCRLQSETAPMLAKQSVQASGLGGLYHVVTLPDPLDSYTLKDHLVMDGWMVLLGWSLPGGLQVKLRVDEGLVSWVATRDGQAVLAAWAGTSVPAGIEHEARQALSRLGVA